MFQLPIGRSHPVLFAALVGALIGVANSLANEIPALFGKPSKGVLTLLAPSSHFSTPANGSGALQIALLLLIEVATNVLVWAAIFSLLGLLFVFLHRMLRSTRR